jgi:hypothetical protein
MLASCWLRAKLSSHSGADDIATGQRVQMRGRIGTSRRHHCGPEDLHKMQAPVALLRACAAFSYHVQAAHYLNVTFAERFVFIAVEKTYPYAVGVYELDAAAMAAGKEQCRIGLQTISNCRAINEWPGYTTTCDTITMPGWALSTTPTIEF